jgi:hypothetical protein
LGQLGGGLDVAAKARGYFPRERIARDRRNESRPECAAKMFASVL